MSVSSTPNSKQLTPSADPSTSAAAPISTTPASTTHEKRSKTRMPPSVREKERREKENTPPRPVEAKHTTPALTAKTAEVADHSTVFTDIVWIFESAIQGRDWDRLGDAIETCSKAGLNFHLLPFADHPDIKRLKDRSAIDVLTAQETLDDEQVSLALDLLNMGADWNAADADGDSVLTLLRRYVDDELRAAISEQFPHFRHLFFDREGRPVKGKD